MAQYASTLDVEVTVKIAPDLVWLVDGKVRACIDVKYEAERHGQYPNADLYQMSAAGGSGWGKGGWCTRRVTSLFWRSLLRMS